jgi:putative peptidoglycan lipid II flippase
VAFPAFRWVAWRSLVKGASARQILNSGAQFAICLLIVATLHINIAVDRMFTSTLGPGATAAYAFGYAIIGIVPALLAFPVFKVLYPEMTVMQLQADTAGLRRLFLGNLFLTGLVTLPLVSSLTAFSVPLTALIFKQGSFDGADTRMTADVLRYMAPGLWPSSASILFTFYFYAAKRIDMIVKLSLLSIVCNVALDFVFIRWLGIGGIALSTSVIGFLRLSFSIYFLQRVLGEPGGRRGLLLPILGTLAAGAAAVGICWTVILWIQSFANFSDGVRTVIAALVVGGTTALLFVGFHLLAWRRSWRQTISTFAAPSCADDS